MKPLLTEDGKLRVELHKVDESRLARVHEIGTLLIEMKQPEGEALIEAVDAVLVKFSAMPDADSIASDGEVKDGAE